MIDVTRETVVSLLDVARRLDVTVQTVRNWSMRQVGAQLETAKFGGKVVTSWEAVRRFGAGGSSAAARKNQPNKPAPSARKKHEAAGKYLESIGL